MLINVATYKQKTIRDLECHKKTYLSLTLVEKRETGAFKKYGTYVY
jgi:hypothetical protein